MEKKFTTIRTKYGKFEVIKKEDKYFLVYLEDEGKQTGKVGYLIKEDGEWYLQEAFFDIVNVPHFDFRSVFRSNLPIDDEIRKDLSDNLIAGCYQIEDAINLVGVGKCIICQTHHKKFWTQFIKSLKNGATIETANIKAGGKLYDYE